MKVIPTSGPVIEASTGAQSQSQISARERAIARLQPKVGTPAELQSLPSQTPATKYPQNHRPQLAVAGHPVQDPSNPTETPEVPETVQDSQTEPVVEAAAEPEATPAPVAEEAPTPQISSQYAQLARQQKAFRAAQVAAKAKESALQEREKAIQAKEAEMQSQYVRKDVFAKDPVKALQEQGFTPEQITNLMLNQPDPAEQQRQAVVDELRAEIKALRDGQESTKKSFEDQQRQSYQQAVNMIRTETKQLVEADANFETIKATDSSEDVVELITKTFEKEGRMLTVEEAASAVEDYLVEEALKIARLNKIQQRLIKPAAPAKAAAAPTPGAPKTATKTLTSSMNTTRPLSAKERAILAFKGELKS